MSTKSTKVPQIRASNKHLPWIGARLYKEPSREERFIRGSFVRKLNHSAFVREFSVQLWSFNQGTTEAEKVTDS
jgi:hypothetical protein